MNTTYHPYDGVTAFLQQAPQNEHSFLYAFAELISEARIGHWTPEQGLSPITSWRAHKNEAEIAGFRRAM
ncbi:hypothetical protein AB9F41_37710, partial [Rhizobium leguminosarum]|uniref:hypothetical protein n=1 Tax=Rhizobium leguminosarum TaxID=384 RepID=UPI003F990D1C